jgi:hypothetical protein
MTSGTKYIGGHGDTTLGMLAVKDVELGKKLYFLQNAEGAGLAPMDCWLALRGLKTVRGVGRCVRSTCGLLAGIAWIFVEQLAPSCWLALRGLKTVRGDADELMLCSRWRFGLLFG